MNKLILAGAVFTAIGAIIIAKVTELHKKAAKRHKESEERNLCFQLGSVEPIAVVGYLVAPWLLIAGIVMIIAAVFVE